MFFFFNDTATTEIYTLSLHDALPISTAAAMSAAGAEVGGAVLFGAVLTGTGMVGAALGAMAAQLLPERRSASGLSVDRKSTRLNSSHANISYAVFCLKKKKNITSNSN